MGHGALADVFRRSGSEGRRIGHRVAPLDLSFDWRPAPAPGRSAPWRRRRRAQQARVLDLSVSGALVAVTGGEPITIGSPVDIELDGAAGMCRVRRVQMHPDGLVAYGVQFTALEPRLEARILEHLASGGGTFGAPPAD